MFSSSSFCLSSSFTDVNILIKILLSNKTWKIASNKVKRVFACVKKIRLPHFTQFDTFLEATAKELQTRQLFHFATPPLGKWVKIHSFVPSSFPMCLSESNCKAGYHLTVHTVPVGKRLESSPPVAPRSHPSTRIYNYNYSLISSIP